MDGGTILVTGANGALGCNIVSEIMGSPRFTSGHGIFTVRNLSAATSLTNVIDSTCSSHLSHEVLPLDLSSFKCVRCFAANINNRVSSGQLAPIRALVLNAGFQEHFTLTKTENGLDMSFQVNHLSHFLLTLLLLKSLDVERGEIVVIGSWTHDPEDTRNMPGLYPSDYRPVLGGGLKPLAEGRWSTPDQDPTAASGLRRYGAAKLCQIVTMLELQRRLDADPVLSKVCVSGIDPGGMPSGIMRRASFLQGVIINNIAGSILAPIMTWWWPNGILRTPAKSAADVIQILTQPGVHKKGLYFNGSEVATTSKEARDPDTGRLVWSESLALAGLAVEEKILH